MATTRLLRSALRSRPFSTTSKRPLEDVYILSAARTATGKFNGAFVETPAPTLGATAVKAALSRSSLPASDYPQITSLYFGHVLQGSVGQSPARQVVIGSGLPDTTEATTINKVCASGLKAVSLAASSITLGEGSLQVAGGMENMSLAPYYLKRNNPAFGHLKLEDALIKDGLWEVYEQIHMGSCAENTARKLGISREAQDAYAVESYKRAKAAWDSGAFAKEIAPVLVKSRKSEIEVVKDEEYESVKLDKIPSLKPAFEKAGTVTAANSSTLSDGASALLLSSGSVAASLSAPPLARIIASADASTAPIDFPLAPTLAIPKVLERAGLSVGDIAKWEINEAFAAVSLAIEKTLGLDASKVNVNGGAIALGHALGSSGSRILVSLLHQLKVGEFGVAAICNGGGGATAVVVQRVDAVGR